MATVTRRTRGAHQDGNAVTPTKTDVSTTNADMKTEDFAPVIEQTEDHVVLDLKNGHPCTFSTIMTLFWYHLFIFSPLAPPIIYGALYLLYRQLGYGVWVVWFLLNLVLFLVPPYYNRAFRQKHLRKVYIPLAHYAKSSKVVLPAKRFPEDRSYILGVHPHGRVMYSTSLISQVYDVFTRVLPDKGDLFGAAAGGFFNVPIIRNWFYALGAVPAGRSSLKKQLNKGNNILIVVGGVKEVCIPTYPDKDVLYLKKRLGFIKLAMETNAGVVPVYLFNENSLFESQPLWFLKFWEKANRYVNVGVPFFRGIYHLPFPFQRDLIIAFGEPLFAKEGESAESFHARYIEALQNLFDKYVGMTVNPKHKLIIT